MIEVSPIKLSQLTTEIYKTINNVFQGRSYWVVADITNHSYYSQKNYHFFDLVEKEDGTNNIQAKISASAWGTGTIKIKEFERITGQKFKNDINVLVKVTVEYHKVHGLKLTVVDIDFNFTIGVLEQQRQQTLQKLLSECSSFIRKDGDIYMTRNKGLKFNTILQRLAVVTSNSSAGYQDFQHTLDNNSYKYKFQVDNYFTTVQGEANSMAIYNKLLDVFNSGIKYDAIVLIRGGGAQTDFIIFDQFPLSKIVAKFPIPIITGIGHQKNETIVDMMAHTCTKTPTKSAEFIIAHNRNFEDAILVFQKQIIIKSQQILAQSFDGLNAANLMIINKSRTFLSHYFEELNRFNQVVINNTKTIIYERSTQLVSLLNQLSTKPKIITAKHVTDLKNMKYTITYFANQEIKNQRSYLGHFVSVVKLMSPSNIIKKGFAIISHNNKIIVDGESISTGDKLTITMHKYSINTKVITKTQSDGK